MKWWKPGDAATTFCGWAPASPAAPCTGWLLRARRASGPRPWHRRPVGNSHPIRPSIRCRGGHALNRSKTVPRRTVPCFNFNKQFEIFFFFQFQILRFQILTDEWPRQNGRRHRPGSLWGWSWRTLPWPSTDPIPRPPLLPFGRIAF